MQLAFLYAFAAFAATGPDVQAQMMYWTDRGKILRADPDGSNSETLVEAEILSPNGVAIDASAGKVYWTDFARRLILRSDLDGSNLVELVAAGVDTPQGIALDPAAGVMYWADEGTDVIYRAFLDGSGVDSIVDTGLIAPQGVAVDASGGKVFWIDSGTQKIQCANLDGSDVEDLVVGDLFGGRGLALDLPGGKLYWTDWSAQAVRRADLDGSNREDVITTGLEGPQSIAIDSNTGVLYLTDAGSVFSAALDGSGLNLVVHSGQNTLRGVAASSNLLFWTERGRLRRCNLDGTDVASVVTAIVDAPGGIDLDVAGGWMYWTDRFTGKIQRSKLDGSDIEDVISGGLESPAGIALDLPRGFIYWAEVTGDGFGLIRRSSLAGGNIETLVNESNSRPQAVDLDAALGKIYWTDAIQGAVRRADLDGTDVQNVASALLPGGVAVDSDAELLYWSEFQGIFRGNLIGDEDMQIVGTGLDIPLGIAIDVGLGRIYWTGPVIHRADLDGSNVMALPTPALELPGGIALDINVPLGDCNVSGAVRLNDHTLTVICYTGPTEPTRAGCECADLNADGTVDLLDFANYQVEVAAN